MNYLFNLVNEVAITVDAYSSSNRLYQPGEKLAILLNALPAHLDNRKVSLQINDELNNLDVASFNFVEFFGLLTKQGLKLKKLELKCNYNAKKHLRTDIGSLAKIMKLSDDLSLKNASFGKRVDRVSPYNASIAWDQELTMDRLCVDGSPFYLRKDPVSP